MLQLSVPGYRLPGGDGLLLDPRQLLHPAGVPGTRCQHHPHVEIVTVLLQAHLKCIVEQEGVMSADEAPDTSYYQWVTFMFCLQVAATTASSQAVMLISLSGGTLLSPLQAVVRPGGWGASQLWH